MINLLTKFDSAFQDPVTIEKIREVGDSFCSFCLPLLNLQHLRNPPSSYEAVSTLSR